jgi:hypothetical protein
MGVFADPTINGIASIRYLFTATGMLVLYASDLTLLSQLQWLSKHICSLCLMLARRSLLAQGHSSHSRLPMRITFFASRFPRHL